MPLRSEFGKFGHRTSSFKKRMKEIVIAGNHKSDQKHRTSFLRLLEMTIIMLIIFKKKGPRDEQHRTLKYIAQYTQTSLISPHKGHST